MISLNVLIRSLKLAYYLFFNLVFKSFYQFSPSIIYRIQNIEMLYLHSWTIEKNLQWNAKMAALRFNYYRRKITPVAYKMCIFCPALIIIFIHSCTKNGWFVQSFSNYEPFSKREIFLNIYVFVRNVFVRKWQSEW